MLKRVETMLQPRGEPMQLIEEEGNEDLNSVADKNSPSKPQVPFSNFRQKAEDRFG